MCSKLVVAVLLVGILDCAVAKSTNPCVIKAVESGRQLHAAQEAFLKCYKDCSSSFMTSSSDTNPQTPEFTMNLAPLAKATGVSLCSEICFKEVAGDFLPKSTVGDPLGIFYKIARTLDKCAMRESGEKDNYFANDLAQFNIDHLKKADNFPDPRRRRLFSIFYPDHLQTFWSGMELYDKSSSHCPEILTVMQSALSALTNALNLCQHWCLLPLATPNSDSSLGRLTQVAQCQHSCFYLLRSDPSSEKTILHSFAEIHHYLQYCLWHTGKHEEAFAHGASYTLLDPSDTSVRDYYIGTGKVALEDFKARPEALYLKEQFVALSSIIKMKSDVNSGLIAGAPSNIGAILNALKTPELVSSEKKKPKEKSPPPPTPTDETCDANSPGSCALKPAKSMRVVGNFSGINGYRRYVVDDLLQPSQCLKLRNMNIRGGRNGDGYPKTKLHGSPYTDYESYVGLGAHRLAELAADAVLLPEEVLLFFSVTDAVLEKTRQLFNLDKLYFYYVHLVCRESMHKKGDKTKPRKAAADPSHPIHADNCGIQENGDCLYDDPLLLPRNYSAVLYLNEDFEGGEFFFAHRPNKAEDLKINARCGRFVAFHASEFHGVKAVTQGTRCSLAMWFTLDQTKEEPARANALKVVRQLLAMRESIPSEPVGPEITSLF